MNDDNRDPNNGGGGDNLLSDAGAEIKGMAKQGLHHPSTKPVLIAAGIGGLLGALTISAPLGVLAGAGFMLYKRLRP